MQHDTVDERHTAVALPGCQRAVRALLLKAIGPLLMLLLKVMGWLAAAGLCRRPVQATPCLTVNVCDGLALNAKRRAESHLGGLIFAALSCLYTSCKDVSLRIRRPCTKIDKCTNASKTLLMSGTSYGLSS